MHLAKYETGLERAEHKMAKRETEMAKCDKDNLRRQAGHRIAAIVILDFLVRWPA